MGWYEQRFADDVNMKGIIKNNGYTLYKECDKNASDRIEQAETN